MQLKFFNTENQSQGFNLLKPAKVQFTIWDKAYYWVSGTCRVIIILVELSLIVALGFRFFLDKQYNDGQKALENAKNRYQTNELSIAPQIRQTQKYMHLYEQLDKTGEVDFNKYRFVNNFFKDIEEFSFAVSTSNVQLSGTTTRETMAAIENAFKTNSNLNAVTVNRLEIDSINGKRYKFDISSKIIK